MVNAVEPLTLVIIEDEEAHFGLMKRTILKAMPKAMVHHFHDATACLAKLHELHPDIIITDYLMPGRNKSDSTRMPASLSVPRNSLTCMDLCTWRPLNRTKKTYRSS